MKSTYFWDNYAFKSKLMKTWTQSWKIRVVKKWALRDRDTRVWRKQQNRKWRNNLLKVSLGTKQLTQYKIWPIQKLSQDSQEHWKIKL